MSHACNLVIQLGVLPAHRITTRKRREFATLFVFSTSFRRALPRCAHALSTDSAKELADHPSIRSTKFRKIADCLVTDICSLSGLTIASRGTEFFVNVDLSDKDRTRHARPKMSDPTATSMEGQVFRISDFNKVESMRFESVARLLHSGKAQHKSYTLASQFCAKHESRESYHPSHRGDL